MKEYHKTDLDIWSDSKEHKPPFCSEIRHHNSPKM